MKITFLQSGGFAGVSRGADFDTASLPAGETQMLLGLLRAAEDSTRAAPPPQPHRPDGTSYLVKIEDGGAARELKLTDGSMTDEAGALVRWLSTRSKPRRL